MGAMEEVRMPTDAVVSSSNELGFRLLSLRTDEDEGNVFISSFSVLLALAMTYNGAEGRTKAVLADLLGFSGLSLDEVNAGCKALISLGEGLEPGVKIEMANAIWVGEGIEPAARFAETIKDAYGGEFTSVDFGDPNTAELINGWVAEQTDDRIQELVTHELIALAIMVLTNAIAFKGVWSRAFDEEQTREMPFTLADGVSKDHPMMSREGMFEYVETDDLQGVELPYGDGRMCMTVLLPKAHISLPEARRMLIPETWEALLGRSHRMRGHLLLPRFRIEYAAELLPNLKAIGGDAIAETDFLSMGAGRLMISSVIHKTFVDVNEEGTEAAAATAVVMARGLSTGFRMMVDKPFFCAIRDRGTGLLLFMGWVLDPT